MGNCVDNNISNLDFLNSCPRIGIGGIKRLWVANFNSNVYPSLQISIDEIIGITDSLKFTELEIDTTSSRFDKTFDYKNNKYQLSLIIQILIVETLKRKFIDSLIKANVIFLIQDYNDKYIMIGEKSGIKSNNYNDSTGALREKTAYNLTYFSNSDYSPYGVSTDLITQLTTVDCSDLDNYRFQQNDLSWYRYRECIITLP